FSYYCHQNQVYDVRILDGKVYINPHSTLSLCLIPVTKITHQGFFEASPPTQPNRKDNLTVVEPGIIKRGKGGTLVNFVSLRHYFLFFSRK
ncbi:hypothetical protein cypCar_00014567, partial [Cyprinus carpio]